MKRLSTIVVGAALVVGCGGRTRPASFATDNRPTLKAMCEAIKTKKTADVERIFKALERREKKDAEEMGAFVRIKALVDKGDWAGAQVFADDCLSASTN